MRGFVLIRNCFGHRFDDPQPQLVNLLKDKEFRLAWEAVERKCSGNHLDQPVVEGDGVGLNATHAILALILSFRVVSCCDAAFCEFLGEHRLVALCAKDILRLSALGESFSDRVRRFNTRWESEFGGSSIHKQDLPEKLKDVDMFKEFRSGCKFPTYHNRPA